MSGEANYKGVDLSFEKRFSSGYGYRASSRRDLSHQR